MGLITRIQSELRNRHVHLLAPAFMLTVGMYLQKTGVITPDGGLPDIVLSLFSLLSVPYLLVYGGKIAPWRELRTLVAVGTRAWFAGSLLLFGIAQQITPIQDPEAALLSLPAGTTLYSLLLGVTGVTILLAGPFAVRWIHRYLNSDDSGGNSGTTPEEKVLSEKELEEFDHPRKELVRVYAWLTTEEVGPN